MAPKNGTRPGPRKGLIQPVLPALPLIARLKKDHAQVKSENKPKQDDVVAAVVTAASAAAAIPDLQSTLPEVQDTTHNQPLSTSPRSPTEDGPVDNTSDAIPDPVHQEFPATLESSKLPIQSPDERIQESIGSTKVETGDTFAAEALSATSQDLETSTVKSADLTPASNEEVLQNDLTEKVFDVLADSIVIDTNPAPEAVTGQVEQTPTVYHSHHPSISISSIQQTPKYAVAMPLSPQYLNQSQSQSLSNGDRRSSIHGIANGHAVSADQMNPANGLRTTSSSMSTGFPTIFHHIRNLQYTSDWFDSDLCVYFPGLPKPAIYRSTHSLILIRSERLRNFIYLQRASSYSYYIINIAPARAIDINAFDAALKFLYDDTVLSAERLFPNTGLDRAGRVRALDYVVSYMISGLELGLEPVVTRALDLLGRILDWDVAELAFKEALLMRSSSTPESNPHAPREGLSAAKSILQHIFNLIILRLDTKHFKIDTVADPAALASRFVNFEPGKSAVNPALANMVFGSMPASHEPAASTPDTVASLIMLNMDFEDLCSLSKGMKEVHGEDGIRIISDVIEERERRRLNILNNRSVPNKQRAANSTAWDVVGWREYTADGNIRQEHVGFVLPNKRGGASS